jgi:hypothetical protein
MTAKLAFSALLLLIVGFALARQGKTSSNSCGFAVRGEPAQPTVRGPDDIVPLVHVVEPYSDTYLSLSALSRKSRSLILRLR